MIPVNRWLGEQMNGNVLKNIVAAALVVIASAAVSSAQVGVAEDTHDFGRVARDTEVSHVFTIDNGSPGMLRVDAVEAG